jgi:hypothetical protein
MEWLSGPFIFEPAQQARQPTPSRPTSPLSPSFGQAKPLPSTWAAPAGPAPPHVSSSRLPLPLPHSNRCAPTEDIQSPSPPGHLATTHPLVRHKMGSQCVPLSRPLVGSLEHQSSKKPSSGELGLLVHGRSTVDQASGGPQSHYSRTPCELANGLVAWWLVVAVASQPTRVRPRIRAFPWCHARPPLQSRVGWGKISISKKN